MNKNDKIFFVAGLPRSGSTLLMNILAQNPKFYSNNTNDLVGLLNIVTKNWQNLEAFKAQGLQEVKPRIKDSLSSMIEGFYKTEFDNKKIVFDKSRGWLQNVELLEEVLGKEVKIIVCTRDVKDIVASFEKLHRKNVLLRSNLYSSPQAAISIRSRAHDICSDGGVVGFAVNSLRDVYQKGLSDRILIVPFEKLTSYPEKTLKGIHKELGLPDNKYDFKKVKQTTKEDDFVYGIENLHSIRPKVESVESDALDILGTQICKEIDESYKDINQLSD